MKRLLAWEIKGLLRTPLTKGNLGRHFAGNTFSSTLRKRCRRNFSNVNYFGVFDGGKNRSVFSLSSSTSRGFSTVVEGKNGAADGDDSEEDDEIDHEFLNPQNWEKRIFEQTRLPYFYNRSSDEIIPMLHDEEEDSDHPLHLDDYKPGIVVLNKGEENEVQRELRFKEFKNLKDERTYYLNCATFETTWKFPYEDQDVVFEIPVLPEYEFKHVVPPELPNAPLWKRGCAAMIDLGVSTIVTCSVIGAMYLELGENELYTVIPAFGPLLLSSFTARDCVLDKGSRSIGKRAMKLEIITDAGLIPSRGHNVIRNIYVPPVLVGSVFFPYAIGILAVDLGLLAFQGKKIGDHVGRTRVIEELEDRPLRLKERQEYVDREVRLT